MTTAVAPRRAASAPPPMDPVSAYARGVLDGVYPAARPVRLACERHLRDMETGHERGLCFDGEEAEFSIAIFGMFEQRKGEWSGQRILLEPWQQFIIGAAFGWKRADNTRRFRVVYIEIPRKNGKTTIAAGVGNRLAWMDDEPGAEVYAVATKRDQAKIAWSEAKWQIDHAPASLKRDITRLTANMHCVATASKFEPLGTDEDGTDGLNIHGLIVDELHAWKVRDYWDKLVTAQGSRRQPLTWIITTAGFDRESICWEQHQYGLQVLDGTVPDDSFFAYIATKDEGDAWDSDAAMVKANPNLGVSVKREWLEEQLSQARALPSKQNQFQRYHLNVWTEQEHRWLDMNTWEEQRPRRALENLEGEPCYLGLDMSSTTDLTCVHAIFPDGADDVDLYPMFFAPEETLTRRSREDRVPYQHWREQGHLQATEGSSVRYDQVRKFINEFGAKYRVLSIAMDPWNVKQLAQELEDDGFEVVGLTQGMASLTGPTKELERLFIQRGLRHGNNPVLRWMASNAVVRHDAEGNIRLDKAKSNERIDGLAALVNAISEWQKNGDGGSVYDERGVIVL